MKWDGQGRSERRIEVIVKMQKRCVCVGGGGGPIRGGVRGSRLI